MMKLFNRLFSTGKENFQPDITRITRTETIEGFSLPCIIHNMQYHLTDLQVYSDGLISCWEMVDLKMFKEKLEQGWVVVSIPEGEAISIFSLGHWYIEQGVWEHTIQSFYDLIYSFITQLNPTLENLHNYNGSNTKLSGKVQVAKHHTPNPKPYYSEDPKAVFPHKNNGEKFHFFFRNDDGKTYLAELSLYKNGRIEITNIPAKKILAFDDLNHYINNGLITTELEIGETINILNLGSFKIKSGSGIDVKNKLDELRDKLDELNGEENSIVKCRRFFAEYMLQPCLELKSKLKVAYESIPEHRRIFVGTMDTKDYEVRQIIYGDVVKKEWERDYGFEYPYEDMPKPLDSE